MSEGKNVFDPKTNRFPYPLDTASHYLVVKKDDGTVFDENYPYIDNSFRARLWEGFVRVLLYAFVFLVVRVRLGLKVEGRENLKKHRAEIKNGIISVCNHVHMWDYLAILSAIRPVRPRILAWDKNISGENGKMIRGVGGIPIPTNSLHGTAAFIKAIEKYLESGWLHVYAEGSMWEYYAPVRPFKTGAAHFACSFDKPIIPLAFSYREPGLIRKKIFGQIALFTLHIGEPLYPDKNLPMKEQKTDLTIRCRDAVCNLAGIDSEHDIYEPIYHNSTRVDYYTTEYGVGYTKSW